jgi:hypothetical protein
MRHRTRSTSKNLLAAPQYNTRQFVALALAMILAVLLIPVGVQAAQVVNAIITDAEGVNQATVDADGDLSVAGNVTVDSTTPVDVTSTDDPGRMAFQRTFFGEWADGNPFASAVFDVPKGKRAVITYVSGNIKLPAGQQLLDLTLSNGAGLDHFFVPTLIATTGRDHFSFSQETTIYAGGAACCSAQVVFTAQRDAFFPTGDFEVSVSGYLIDCSVAACDQG